MKSERQLTIFGLCQHFYMERNNRPWKITRPECAITSKRRIKQNVLAKKKIDKMNKELALNAKSRLSVVVASTAHLTRVPPIGRRRLPSDVSSPRSPSLSVWWSLFARSFLLSQTAAAVDYLFVHINTSRHRRERTTHRSSMIWSHLSKLFYKATRVWLGVEALS